MKQLLPFALFAFVASITPGPTNILILSNSARFGLAATLPLVFSACGAAALIVLLVGLGAGEWLLGHPQLQQAMAWLGLAWLMYLAWQIANSPADPIEADTDAKRLGPAGAAGLQLVNPKTWMMAFAVVSLFAGAGSTSIGYGTYALVFLLISIPCLSAWALLGRGAARFLRAGSRMKAFNVAMALLLVLSAVMGVWKAD
ncbi:LysE family translocator [Pseudomonas sp. RIT-PI-AD]|uniref:LysE family translocator n=1 Tax=Pseudomonas sp. RIT-PI-AD TaxID=3035294 RepID=UPI0021D92089|nr:LysE family translocator [Pseudomonas sp. RIT-PI-AD]